MASSLDLSESDTESEYLPETDNEYDSESDTNFYICDEEDEGLKDYSIKTFLRRRYDCANQDVYKDLTFELEKKEIRLLKDSSD
ncbi:hypothetical protein TNCV_4095181 [Trichonephila clavipes]|uniref:Uncharacterized protein n=1 Tax=Trichonephila clavipes TaxID=2585209 RepID=A0A8X6SA71_TRICX|nr:hypothetical protein TNCV_4095181 [Trichonephila clavipes]